MDWSTLIVEVEPAGTVTLLDYFKTFLGIADGTKDAELTAALNSSGPTIETYLDRVVAKRQVTEQYPHHWGTVVLHHPAVDPVAGITVYLNESAQSGYDMWMDRGGLAHLSRTGVPLDTPFDWRKFDQVTVAYTAGFDPLPVDLANGIIYVANDFYSAQGNVPGGATGEMRTMQIYDVGSVSYDTGSGSSLSWQGGVISDQIAEMLSSYLRMSS